jgi:hypothetical protein
MLKGASTMGVWYFLVIGMAFAGSSNGAFTEYSSAWTQAGPFPDKKLCETIREQAVVRSGNHGGSTDCWFVPPQAGQLR